MLVLPLAHSATAGFRVAVGECLEGQHDHDPAVATAFDLPATVVVGWRYSENCQSPDTFTDDDRVLNRGHKWLMN